jgi:hypothetical protein
MKLRVIEGGGSMAAGEFEIVRLEPQPDGTIKVHGRAVLPSPPFNGILTARVLRDAIPEYTKVSLHPRDARCDQSGWLYAGA